MAKKNSSKTVTEKAMQASEPKQQVFYQWQGVSFIEAPLGWEPLENSQQAGRPGLAQGYEQYWTRQTDLKPQFLMVQNNVETTDNLTLETRPDSRKIVEMPEDPYGWKNTGVVHMFHHWMFLGQRLDSPVYGGYVDRIMCYDMLSGDKTYIMLHNRGEADIVKDTFVKEILTYEGKLIATASCYSHVGDDTDVRGKLYLADLNYEVTRTVEETGDVVTGDSITVRGVASNALNRVTSLARVEDPGNVTAADAGWHTHPEGYTWDNGACHVWPVGDLKGNTDGSQFPADDEHPEAYSPITRFDVTCCWTNMLGSTVPSPMVGPNDTPANHPWCSTLWTNHDPVTFSSARYIHIWGWLPNDWEARGITGVDIYTDLDNKQTKAFIGHVDSENFVVDRDNNQYYWRFNWVGSMQDVSAWTNVALKVPEENSTQGAPCSHVANHDSRLYFWGDGDHPYRLYIGGNPGSELSISRGLGGAWIDIEPGTGYEVKGTAKWKTVAGASIVTIMCGNPNTNMVKRFNLVETNTTITNEVSSKGYMYEEVSNVVGCNSRWGYGVFADGLYSINRYGLMLTTMAMEYNSQMRNTNVSKPIEPIFTGRMGDRLYDTNLVCINDRIYIAVGADDYEEQELQPPASMRLDQVVLVYDIDTKAWYTFTHDQVPRADGGKPESIHRIFAVDSDQHCEGLGLITDHYVYLYPTAGYDQEGVAPEFNALIETGELTTKVPKQETHYIQQLELRFDYFVGNCDVVVEGVDYYGRPFRVLKHLNSEMHGGLMRDRTEYIRVEKWVESYRLRLIGQARFRLTAIVAKLYTTSRKVGMPYGYDAHDMYGDQHRRYLQQQRETLWDTHHDVKDYNDLRKAIVT